MDEPRYYTRSAVSGLFGGGGVLHRIYIRDRWYGCRDVYQEMRPSGGRGGTQARVPAEVEAMCAVWNAEHEENVRGASV